MVGHLLTHGEYSDFSIIGMYEFPSREWLVERVKEYRAVVNPTAERYNDHIGDFPEWLTENYPDDFRAVEYHEFWLGAYSTFGDEALGKPGAGKYDAD